MEEFPGAEAFREWLLSQGEDTVGVVCDSCNCPLANWLTVVAGKPFRVTPSWYGDQDGEELSLLPAWAARFVSEVDGWDSDGQFVLRDRAVLVLDEVLAQMGLEEVSDGTVA